MKFHILPSDVIVKNMYEKLIRNKTLRLNTIYKLEYFKLSIVL